MITCHQSSSVHRCPATTLNDFSSETPGPILVKLHVEPSVKRGLKIFSYGSGQLIKITAMSIYGKNTKKSFPEPRKLYG